MVIHPFFQTQPGRHIIAFILLLVFIYPEASLASETKCWDIDTRTRAFGHYTVIEYKQYGGSILTPEQVTNLAQDGLVIQKDLFRLRDTVLENPYYEFKCQTAFVEGNVPPPAERLSNFYGFATKRKTIPYIDVYSKKGEAYPLHRLECANNQLLELYAGWLFKMKKTNE